MCRGAAFIASRSNYDARDAAMKRAVLATLGTITAIVVLLDSKSAPIRAARPPFVSPLGASQPPIRDTPTTQPAAATTRAVAAQTSAAAPTKTATQFPTTGPTRSAARPTKAASDSFLGASVQTRYGPVQIKITYAAGRVTGVVAVQLPSGRSRDAEINNYAVPILESETLTAQSANINAVSGATYTSDGYVQSLQFALDAAHR